MVNCSVSNLSHPNKAIPIPMELEQYLPFLWNSHGTHGNSRYRFMSSLDVISRKSLLKKYRKIFSVALQFRTTQLKYFVMHTYTRHVSSHAHTTLSFVEVHYQSIIWIQKFEAFYHFGFTQTFDCTAGLGLGRPGLGIVFIIYGLDLGLVTLALTLGSILPALLTSLCQPGISCRNSDRLSVTRVPYDKSKQCTADTLIPHKRAITLLF